jgi:hypothetical protein
MSGVYRGFGTRHPADAFGLRRAVFQRELLPEPLVGIFDGVAAAAQEPFRGLTSDGDVVDGLFALGSTGIDTTPVVRAAEAFLEELSDAQRRRTLYAADTDEVRRWTNAYPMWEPHGVLLDELETGQRELAMAVVAAATSARGFRDTRRAMLFNEILAELTGDVERDSLGEWIYFMAIFGTPSAQQPWGWQLWGHHLLLTCYFVGDQMVMTPAFLGAEPTIIDEGPYAGMSLFDRDRELGMTMLHGLGSAQQDEAILYRSMLTADLPPELTHLTEGRHRAGNGADNLVYPYEGVSARSFSDGQRRSLLGLVDCFVGRMNDEHARLRMQEVERHLDHTHFAWIGDPTGTGAFYYKVHSPVIVIEYDNHTGVFLDNPEPEPFHVHTVVRTPNCGDYGRDLLRQHYAHAHGGAHHHPAGGAASHRHAT